MRPQVRRVVDEESLKTGWLAAAASDSVSVPAEGLLAEASERIAPSEESTKADPHSVDESRSPLIKLYETLGQAERRDQVASESGVGSRCEAVACDGVQTKPPA